jgi:hypothetical protein
MRIFQISIFSHDRSDFGVRRLAAALRLREISG